MSEIDDRASPVSAAGRLRLRRRYAAERRFRAYGIAAITLALGALALLLVSIVGRGFRTLHQYEVTLPILLDPALLDPQGERDPAVLGRADYGALVRASLEELFPEVTARRDRRALRSLVSAGAEFELRDRVASDPSLVGQRISLRVPISDEADLAFKGQLAASSTETERKLSDAQLGWLRSLDAEGRIERAFNWRFFASGDSREPELAGIRGALMGSLLTLLVTLVLSFPVGVGTAVYLEELAHKSGWNEFVEVNINNLAAVPSIVFGLLGLAMFLNFFGLPRSAPLVGGMVLALMTLPTIIIASRSAIQSVPPSIREAALAMGASRLQTVTHHVLPLAMPGILTGTIIGMARALGETAPLLMIGMVAFIVEVPTSFSAPATALPVQIFLWADSPERAFADKTSAAILVLLAFLIVMNLAAVLLRHRFERRW